MTLQAAAERVKEAFGLPYAAVFGKLDGEAVIQKAAVCPGAGGSTMGEALAAGRRFISQEISATMKESTRLHRAWRSSTLDIMELNTFY